jgi:hypothetical protein
MTLIAQKPIVGSAGAASAFATPTIVHFGTVLLVAALLRAPWHAIAPVAALCGLVGVTGAVYALLVARRMRVQSAYRPVFEDWLFHVLLPLTAYATLAVSGFAAPSHTREALFGIGAAALLLLFVGIHNAWDSTAYHVLVNRPNAEP